VSEERHLFRHGAGPASGADAAPTNWASYGLSEIWQMVDGEDGWVSWNQYDAWHRMAALCDDQAAQLSAALAQLARRWPPTPGSASYAFAAWVEAMVASMRRSADAARRNQGAIYEITVALGSARAEIAGLVEQAGQYALAEQQLLPQPLPSPDQRPQPAASGVARPPYNWRAVLDQQAQRIMAHTDVAVGAQAQAIEIPPEFSGYAWSDGGEVFYPDGIAAAGSRATYGGAAPFRLAHATPPPPLTATVGAGPPTAQDGVPIGVPPPGTGVPSPVIWPNPGVGSVPAAGGPVVAGGVIGIPAPSVGSPPARGAAPATGRTAARSGPSSMVPATAVGRPPSGASSGAVGRRQSAASWRRRRSPDPNDPWAAPKGSCAVLEPTPEVSDHSPGPGVIGLTS
jgi:hypothetical protein